MDTHSLTRNRIHPLVALAALSVILASAVAIGVMTGVLPTGRAGHPDTQIAASSAPAPAAVSSAAPVSAANTVQPAQTVPVTASPPAPQTKPAAKPVARNKPAPKAAERTPESAPVARSSEPPPAPAPVAQANVPAIPPDYQPPIEAKPAPKPACADCGVIESFREVEQKGPGTGLGAVAGGVTGAIVGRNIGNGDGRTLATILGAAGGAFAGHQIEKNTRTTKRYEVLVRMNDGTTRVITQDSAPPWRAGDRVRVINGVVQADLG